MSNIAPRNPDCIARQGKATKDEFFTNIRKKEQKPRIVVVLGPTSSGKSELAVRLAKKFNGEIISADSRQVYRELDIGSGKILRDKILPEPGSKFKVQNSKPSAKQPEFFYKGVRHYLLDVASPKHTFTVSQYQKLGQKAINEVLSRGRLPIICGGTGFYIDALVYNYALPALPPDKKLRAELEKLSAPKLFAKLQKLDPRRADDIDRRNPRRLIRALEIVLTTKRPVPELKKESPYDVFKIGIRRPDKILKRRIHLRLLARLRQGMIAEVKKLHIPPPAGYGLSWKKLENFGLEYRWLARYLQNKITKKEMIEKLNTAIWHYARRQMTWWRKDKNIRWLRDCRTAEKFVDLFLRRR